MDSRNDLKVKRDHLISKMEELNSEYHNTLFRLERSKLLLKIFEHRLELNEIENKFFGEFENDFK